MKCFLLTILLTPTLYAFQSPVTATPQDDVVEQILAKNKGAIVYIDASFSQKEADAPNRHENGLGFIISKSGYLLTAAHVLKPRADETLEEIRGSVRSPQGFPYKLNLIIPDDGQFDVALLQMPDVQDEWNSVTIDPQNNPRLKPGMTLIALSMPPRDASVRPILGTLSSLTMITGPNGALMPTSVQFSSGDSGCPIFNTSGEVVGLCSAGDPLNANQTYLKPITFAKGAITIAKELSLAQQTSKLKNPDGSSSPIVMYASISDGASRTVSQRYCTNDAKRIELGDVIKVSSSPGSSLHGISVDSLHPNCVNVAATLRNFQRSNTGQQSTAAWIGVDVNARAINANGSAIISPKAIANLQLTPSEIKASPSGP